MEKVFISYSSTDRKFVEEFVNDLKIRSVDVWYDKDEIQVGDSITSKIGDGINKSDWLILILSKASINSKWVQLELQPSIALMVERGAFILPVLIEEVEIPFLLRDRRYANFTGDRKTALNDLLKVISPNMPKTTKASAQVASGLLSKIFERHIFELKGSKEKNNSIEKIKKTYKELSNNYKMTEIVYDIYISTCIEKGELLSLTRFIEITPQIMNAPNTKVEIRETLASWLTNMLFEGLDDEE